MKKKLRGKNFTGAKLNVFNTFFYQDVLTIP